MGDEILSIIAKEKEIEINSNASDRTATLVRGIIGIAPYIGPMLAEAITSVIPNQKLDRVITFIKVLNDKVGHLEEDVLKVKIQSEEFTDLLEDGINQASRAVSDERRDYIASLLKNSITNEELGHIGKKKLLSILNDLNDAEILILKYRSLSFEKNKHEFMEHHKNILFPDSFLNAAVLNPDQKDLDNNALMVSYTDKLIQMSLLRRESSNNFEEKGYSLTGDPVIYHVKSLGKLLLRYIDLSNEPFAPQAKILSPNTGKDNDINPQT